jgi:hypothetical protein
MQLLKGRNNAKEVGVDESIVLKWILGKRDREV